MRKTQTSSHMEAHATRTCSIDDFNKGLLRDALNTVISCDVKLDFRDVNATYSQAVSSFSRRDIHPSMLHHSAAVPRFLVASMTTSTASSRPRDLMRGREGACRLRRSLIPVSPGRQRMALLFCQFWRNLTKGTPQVCLSFPTLVV